MYIIIETGFGTANASIMTNIFGEVLVFDSKAEARALAIEECQNGKIIYIDEP